MFGPVHAKFDTNAWAKHTLVLGAGWEIKRQRLEGSPSICFQKGPKKRWPEDETWNAFQAAHRGGGRKKKEDWINARAALAAKREGGGLQEMQQQEQALHERHAQDSKRKRYNAEQVTALHSFYNKVYLAQEKVSDLDREKITQQISQLGGGRAV